MQRFLFLIFLLILSFEPTLWAKAPQRITDYFHHTLEIDYVIYFDPGKDTIKESSFPTLKNVAEIIKGNPQVEAFKVEGYTDASESPKASQPLSLRRANKVILFLGDEGIPASHLIPVGRGSENPVANNDTPEGRAKNRRVEFIVVNDRDAR